MLVFEGVYRYLLRVFLQEVRMKKTLSTLATYDLNEIRHIQHQFPTIISIILLKGLHESKLVSCEPLILSEKTEGDSFEDLPRRHYVYLEGQD